MLVKCMKQTGKKLLKTMGLGIAGLALLLTTEGKAQTTGGLYLGTDTYKGTLSFLNAHVEGQFGQQLADHKLSESNQFVPALTFVSNSLDIYGFDFSFTVPQSNFAEQPSQLSGAELSLRAKVDDDTRIFGGTGIALQGRNAYNRVIVVDSEQLKLAGNYTFKHVQMGVQRDFYEGTVALEAAFMLFSNRTVVADSDNYHYFNQTGSLLELGLTGLIHNDEDLTVSSTMKLGYAPSIDQSAGFQANDRDIEQDVEASTLSVTVDALYDISPSVSVAAEVSYEAPSPVFDEGPSAGFSLIYRPF
jgi:hypothetical protein